MPEIPVIAPAAVIPQSEVLIDPVSPASPKVKVELAVNAPLAVRPEVAVMSPEIVGVAVQEIGETVKPEPAIVVA